MHPHRIMLSVASTAVRSSSPGCGLLPVQVLQTKSAEASRGHGSSLDSLEEGASVHTPIFSLLPCEQTKGALISLGVGASLSS